MCLACYILELLEVNLPYIIVNKRPYQRILGYFVSAHIDTHNRLIKDFMRGLLYRSLHDLRLQITSRHIRRPMYPIALTITQLAPPPPLPRAPSNTQQLLDKFIWGPSIA